MDLRFLVYGLGVTGSSVVRAMVARGLELVAVDDRIDRAREVGAEFGVEQHGAPSDSEIERLVKGSDVLIAGPGLPDDHPALAMADQHGVRIWSEFDLAARWDDRPLVAVTGTDGKTTVTTLVAAMLESSGLPAAAAGNTEIPLVTAIDDERPSAFVVEASSFRLARSETFRPHAAAWLNFAPDHLDVHRDLATYEAAKARIWRDQTADQVAIGNLDDPVVAGHLARAPGRRIGFGGNGAYRVEHDRLTVDGEPLVEVAELPRRFPHDLSNALAAAACTVAMGGSRAGIAETLRSFRGLPHRIQLVAEIDGTRWYDDSKSTVPHATVTAATSFDSVVLIAGGRNKGLDLAALVEAAPALAAVVGIGESGVEVVSAFAGRVPGVAVGSMADAVAAAADVARPGQTVLLSPGCASFDWYGSYHERGDDFQRLVRQLAGTEEQT